MLKYIFDSWCRTLRSIKKGSPKGGPFRLSATAFSKVFRQPPPRWFAFRLFSNVAQRTGFASKSRLLWEQPCAAMGRKAALAISDRNSETSALPQALESPIRRLFAPGSPNPGKPAPMCVVPLHDHCCSG